MNLNVLGFRINDKQLFFISVIGIAIAIFLEIIKLDFFIPFLIWLSLVVGIIYVTYLMIHVVRSGIP